MEPDEYARLVAPRPPRSGPPARRSSAGRRSRTRRSSPARSCSTGTRAWTRRRSSRPPQAGALLLMSPGSKAYLDMKYDASTELGLEWAGHIELRDAYDWEPSTLIAGVPAGVRDRRRGGHLDRDAARPAGPHADAAAAAGRGRRGGVVRAGAPRLGGLPHAGSPGRRRSGTASGCPGTASPQVDWPLARRAGSDPGPQPHVRVPELVRHDPRGPDRVEERADQHDQRRRAPRSR